MSEVMDSKKRAILLKELRVKYEFSVNRTKELLKEQKAIRKQICEQIRKEPKPIPEIARITGLDGQEILWQITAMKKYGQVEEAGMCGEYYLYRMVGNG